ncbi:MAG: hypothetical protein SF187_28610 [Deltaproteobacteria bacterium]|nr:hypothetical protein [Deltaproteobacteria bacterium]
MSAGSARAQQKQPEGAPPEGCSAEALLAHVTQLFPPALPKQRMAAARALGACATTTTEGALAAALQTEPEPAIRSEVTAALAQQPSAFGLWALQNARRDPDERVRSQAELGISNHRVRVAEQARVRAAETTPTRPQEAPPSPPEAAPQPEPVREPAPAVATAEHPAAPAEATAPTLALPPLVPAPPEPQLTLLPERPRAPAGPTSGVPLLVTTSLLAGSAWGAGLALMADQNSAGVMMLLGSAGAVIGGGTAFALSRFGVRPTVDQAIWFTNATAWGALAGLMAYAGSGADDARLQAGLLVGGESLGLVLGAWSASRYTFRPSQTALADGVVMASALTIIGAGRWRGESDGIPAWMGYGTAPVMLGAAMLAQRLRPTPADARFVALSTVATSATLGLFASGLAGDGLLNSAAGQGGLIAGLGAGFLASAVTSPFVEPTSRQLSVASLGWLAGAGFGVGTFMVAFPDDEDQQHRALGAALGAATFAGAGYWIAPHLHPGPQALQMGFAGTLLGAGLWSVAGAASGTWLTDDQHTGGALALGVAGGLAGMWASNRFAPAPQDYAAVVASMVAGMAGGAGVAKLASSQDAPAFTGVLVGGLSGLTLGAWASHNQSLAPSEFAAGAMGAVYGVLLGANLRNLSNESAVDDRITDGAQYLGLSLGAFAGLAAARWTHASMGQVAVPGIAMGLGMVMGASAGDLAAGAQGGRIGSTIGGIGLAAAAVGLDSRLKLSQGLGPDWFELGVWGGVLGGFEGLLLADLANEARGDNGQARSGMGWLAGTTAGVASGLVLSKLAQPDARDYVFTASGSLLGLSLGFGIASALHTDDGASAGLMFGGSLTGLVSAALVAHAIEPTPVDLTSELLGSVYGVALGSLVTQLDGESGRWGRAQSAGAGLGLALGGVGGVLATRALGASAAQVTTAATGTALMTMAGLGLGLAWPHEGSQATRIGGAVGLSAGLVGTIVADRWMNFSSARSPHFTGLTLAGTVLGGYQGLLLGEALSVSAPESVSGDRQRTGGLMFGSAAGAITGMLLSRSTQPEPEDLFVVGAGSAVGSVFGAGLSRLAAKEGGAHDTWAQLAGSMTGLVGFAAMQRYAPMTGTDAGAAVLGTSLGALVGGLAPSLHLSTVSTSDRTNVGGLLLGAGAGTMLGIVSSKVTDAQPQTVAVSAWGTVHGAATGMAVGNLFDDQGNSQGLRIGLVAGAVGGTAIASLLWRDFSMSDDQQRHTLAAATTVGAWSGWWVGKLASDDDQDKSLTSTVAGAGVASMLAISAAPHLHISDDVLGDALVMNFMLGGAAGGVTALASTDNDNLSKLVLVGSGGGLLLGGLLHNKIILRSQSAPLLTIATAQGSLAGLLLARMIHGQDASDRHKQGAQAVGTLGGAAAGLLLSSVLSPDAGQAAVAGLGSASGAAVGGGIALIANRLDAQEGAALTLGGSLAGLTAGALFARGEPVTGNTFARSSLGAAFGAAEGAVFSWAARGTTEDDYKGSILLGAGLGTSLALASTSVQTWKIPASAGFGAWGAWVGSFAGAMVKSRPQEATLGGLIGLNLGVAAGYGALTADWVEPADFGWLSLFGAAGTLVGGATGALFSSSKDSTPAFVGLAVGPVVGLGVGAAMLPTWRRLRGPQADRSARAPAGTLAAALDTVNTAAPPPGRMAQWAQHKGRRLKSLVEVDQVMPLVGAMPSDGQSGTPTPFVVGLTGRWR